MRDYHFSSDTFLGFKENKIEKNINPDRKKYLDELKESFLNYPFVKERFKSPELVWDNASSVNKDGSQYIIDNLLPSANDKIKIKHCIKSCNYIIDDSVVMLEKYLHIEEEGQQVSVAQKEARDLLLSVETFIDSNIENFSKLMKSLMLSEDKVYNIFHKKIRSSESSKLIKQNNHNSRVRFVKNNYPAVSSKNSFDENLDIIRDIKGYDDNEDVNKNLKELYGDALLHISKHSYDVDDLDAILTEIFNYWSEKVGGDKIWENNLNLKNQIIKSLEKSFKRQDLKEMIRNIIEDKFNIINVERKYEYFFASATTQIINEFVISFGFRNINQENIDRIKNHVESQPEYRDNNPLLNNVLKNIYSHDNLDIDKRIEDVFKNDQNDYVTYFDNFNKWKVQMNFSMINNCGVKNYNEKHNSELKDILDNFKNSKIN